MIGQRLTTRRLLTWASLAILGTMLGAAVARADDFGGQSSGGGNDPPPPNPPCNSCPCAGPGGGGGDGGGPGNSNDPPWALIGKPVSLFTGAEEMMSTDLAVNGVVPILIQRKYDSRSTYDSALGYGWAFMHERRLYEYPDNSAVVRHGCGTRDRYVLSGGAFVTPPGSMLTTLSAEPDGSFRLKYLNGFTDTFDSQGRLIIVTDARGNRLEYSYDSRGKLPLVGSSKASLSPTQPTTVAYNYRLTRIDVRGADGVLTGRYVTFGYDEATGRLTSVTADDGRAVTYQHDVTQSLTLGNLTQVDGLEGVVSTYAYADPLDPHNLTSITPAQGRTPIVNTYDDQDRVTRQVEGARQLDIVYNVAYTKTTVTKTIRDHNGLNPYTAATVYDFDASGRVTKLTDALGNETRYTYDAAKMLTRKEIWQKVGAVLSLLQAKNWTYDANGNKVTEWVTLDSGETITRSWTYNQNWIASVQVVSSAAPTKIFRTEYTFYLDAQGRPVNVQSRKRRRDAGSFQVTTYTYDGRNRLLTATLPGGVQIVNEYTGEYVTRTYFAVAGSALPELQRRFEYDDAGNRIKVWDARNNLTQYGYDDKQRMISVTNPLGEQTLHTYTADLLTQMETGRTVADGEGQVTKFIYDSRDRLIGIQRKNDAGAFVDYRTFQLDSEEQVLAVTDGEDRTTRYAYDTLGRLTSVTDPANEITQLGYDAADNRTRVKDALNREVNREFDDLNRPIAVIESGVTPSPRTEYRYDAFGNVVAVTDPQSHETIYDYDALGRRIRVTQALGQFVQYAYDDRDRIDFIINARGQKVDLSYEDWGALSAERQYPTAAATTADRTIEYAYDDDGNVTSVTDDGIQALPAYSFTYDALSRVLDETVKYLPGGDRVLQRRYDRYGNRSEVTLHDGSAFESTYSFNKLNQLAGADLAGAALGISYSDSNDRQTITFPGGITESFAYRSNGPIETISVSGPAGLISQLAYAYDDVRKVDTQTDAYGVHDFNYDGLDRLTQTLRAAASGLPNESYAYDGVGNREDPVNAALYAYDVNNRITASPGKTYTFDADGSLSTTSDGQVFVHDARSRLTGFSKAATTASYVYDATGRRVRKTVNGTTTWFLWDRSRLLAEFDASGNRSKRYGYLGDDPTPIQVQDVNGTYYVHSDHLQTPRLMTNAGAQVVWRARYEAFGKALVENDPDGNGIAVEFRMRFPGQYADEETGLLYNVNRWYSPDLGRYISADPLGLAAGTNLYLYANGNPLAYIDPLGLICGDWFVTDRKTHHTLKQKLWYLGEAWWWEVVLGDLPIFSFDDGLEPTSILTGSPPKKPGPGISTLWYWVKLEKWLVQDYMEYWDLVKRSRACAETYEDCGELKARSWIERDTEMYDRPDLTHNVGPARIEFSTRRIGPAEEHSFP